MIQLILANVMDRAKLLPLFLCRIFETLSRRRRSSAPPLPPLPLPADYTHPGPSSVTAIIVSSDQIKPTRKKPNRPTSAANDWGSEFSDSEPETEEYSSTTDQDGRSNTYNSHDAGSGSFTEEDFPRPEEETFEENIYELPDGESLMILLFP